MTLTCCCERPSPGRAATSRAVAIAFVRALFHFAYNDDQRLIAAPVLFGQGFKPPRVARGNLDRGRGKLKMFTADQLREILATARRPMKAMILMGVNCGFGNFDLATLTFDALDLEEGWHTHPRPKTPPPTLPSLAGNGRGDPARAEDSSAAERPRPQETSSSSPATVCPTSACRRRPLLPLRRTRPRTSNTRTPSIRVSGRFSTGWA